MRPAPITRASSITAVAFALAVGLTVRALPLAQGVPTGPNPPATQTTRPAGLVVGQVLDAATSRPVAGATVAMSSVAVTRTLRVLTDNQGRFLFRDLPKGTYTFAAIASGYLDGAYGQRRPGGATQPFALAEDQRVGDVAIRLWREATLAGTVTDETGSPVVDVLVSIARREMVGGRAQFNSPLAIYGARTDDRGAYQLVGLPPGDYLVSVTTRTTAMPDSLVGANSATLEPLRASGSYALSMGMGAMSPGVSLGGFVLQTSNQGVGGSNALVGRLPSSVLPDGRILAYPTTFYPSMIAASEATVISLQAGEDRSSVDLQLRPVPMVRVSGTLIGPNGPEPHFAVHLVPAYASGQSLERTHEAAVTATDANGAFTFPAVPSGQYVLKAWNLPQVLVIGSDPMPPDSTRWGETPVSVGDAAMTGVTLTLRPGLTLSGRVEFSGSTPKPRPQQTQTLLSVAFEPTWPLALGARFGTRVTADGNFITQGVPPGLYFPKLLNAFSAPGWFLESAVWEGRDLMTSPIVVDGQNVSEIVIRFTDRRTQLSGTVQNSSGKPDPNAAVLVFPADYRAWIQHGMFVQAARVSPASQAGTYAADGLKPGDYLAVAASEAFLADWQQAQKIEALAPLATRVTLALGEVKRLDLKSAR